MPRVRVFIASSVDGFIAGPNNEIDWLGGDGGQTEDTFTAFFAQIGAMLMGRRTYDVVNGIKGQWPYGEMPVLVATRQPLQPSQSTVRAVAGTIEELVTEAKETSKDKDVYVGGGRLIRCALDAGLVDEITVTLIPTILGQGIPLFAGVAKRHRLQLVQERSVGGSLVELTYRPRS